MDNSSVLASWTNWKYCPEEFDQHIEQKEYYNDALKDVLDIRNYLDDDDVPYEIRFKYMEQNEQKLLELARKLSKILNELGEANYTNEEATEGFDRGSHE